jgi:formate hydrogenlyase subunit 3/multisubunit Na+/H+ antiporter MnhD subunit
MRRHLPSILAGAGAAVLMLAGILIVAASEGTGTVADSLSNANGTMAFGLGLVAAAYSLRLYRDGA